MRFSMAALAAILLATTACRSPKPGSGQSGRSAVRKVPVETVVLTPRALKFSIDTVGSIEARDVIRVPARVTGVVDEVRFEVGQRVRRGTLLARIDSERYQLSLTSREALVRQAEATAREAESMADRRRRLSEGDSGIVSSEDVANAVVRADETAAALAAAKAARDMAAKDVRDSEVRAAMDGVIEERLVSTGQHVTMGAPLATLIDASRLKLVFHVAESESSRIAEGSRVTFRVAALPGRELEAIVAQVAQSANPATRQVSCFAWIESPPPELRAGFFADVKIATGENPAALVLPQVAVQPTDRGIVAYVVDDQDIAHERSVHVGLTTQEGEVEILDGLVAGERVVTKGAAALREGAPVVDAGNPRPVAGSPP